MKKRITALALALVMALTLTAPAFAAKIDTSNMPGHEILAALPDTLQRPARPTTLEQADVNRGLFGTKWEGGESVLQELTALTDSLTAGKTTDTEKMKAIYDWVTQNVKYDSVAYRYWLMKSSELNEEQRRQVGEASEPFHVYTKRLAVCSGYTSLCWLMGTIAEIPVAEISGISNELNRGPHAWNAALVDGKWLFFDATWSEWDMAPNYHTSSGGFGCYDGLFQLSGYRWDNTNRIAVVFRPGFQCPASVTIPSYTTEIGGDAFSSRFVDCASLKSVTIPASVTEIGPMAFEGCTGLESINIPNGVTEIENYVFSGCTSLKSITIPDGVTRIWAYAFKDCTSLKSVSIPGSVTSMGDGAAFYGCTALEDVTIQEGVTEIGDHAFMDCTALKSVTIPGSVATIGKHAFMGCTGLESVTIPNSVTTIEDMAFFGCTNLKHADLPDSVTSLGNGVFTGCPKLESVTVPASMTSIGIGAFQGRTDLESFVIPDHITEIGDRAFRSCTNLKSVTIPNSVTIIGNSAFWGCTGLESVTIPSSVTTIEYGAFAMCDKMTSMTIPEGVISIGGMATPNSLTSIAIPTSVTSIGNYNLGGSMKDVYYAGTEEQWNAISFEEPSFLDRITIHYNSTGPETPAAGKAGFADVPAGAYYTEAVKWAVEKKITAGTSDTTFSPDSTCTTAQILTFL